MRGVHEAHPRSSPGVVSLRWHPKHARAQACERRWRRDCEPVALLAEESPLAQQNAEIGGADDAIAIEVGVRLGLRPTSE